MKKLRHWLSQAPPGTLRDFIYSLLAFIAAAALGLLIPAGTGLLFGWVVPQADLPALAWTLTGMMIAACVGGALEWTGHRRWLRMGERVRLGWESEIWARAIGLPFDTLRNAPPQQSAERAMALKAMINRLTEWAPKLQAAFAGTLGNLGFMLLIHPLLAMTGILYAGAALLVMLGLNAKRAHALEALHQRANELHAEGLEWMRGAGVLQVAGASKTLEKRLVHLTKVHARAEGDVARADLLRATLFSGALALPCLVLFAASDLTELEIGPFLAYLVAFGMLMNSLRVMADFRPIAAELRVLAKRIRPLLACESPVHHPAPQSMPTGALEVERVTFRYAPDLPAVVSNFSLTIAPGEIVQLTGPTGCGKSTLLRLMIGLDTPETGSIRWDRQELRTLDQHHLQAGIGVVWQRAEWSPGDLMSNIAGESDLTLEEAWRAAELAGIAEEIRRLPMQMRTLIAEGATNFSAGQRQRLQIARALARRPHTLLIDGPSHTPNLKILNHVLGSLKGQISCLLISHQETRLPAIDRVIRMPSPHQPYRSS